MTKDEKYLMFKFLVFISTNVLLLVIGGRKSKKDKETCQVLLEGLLHDFEKWDKENYPDQYSENKNADL